MKKNNLRTNHLVIEEKVNYNQNLFDYLYDNIKNNSEIKKFFYEKVGIPNNDGSNFEITKIILFYLMLNI